jgi:hypothetical protein
LATTLGVEGYPVAYLPGDNANMESGTDGRNLLGYVLDVILGSMVEYGATKVDVVLGFDKSRRQWVITVCQIDGRGFECLEKAMLFGHTGEGGGLCDQIRRARGWMQMEIRSLGKKRNPHACTGAYCRPLENEVKLHGVTEFELRVSLC